MHSLIEKFENGASVKQVLEEDKMQEAYWATGNASHWPMTKPITDNDVLLVIQRLIENEVIVSRKFEIDQLAEGLSVIRLHQLIRENKEVCSELLSYDFQSDLTPERFLNLLQPLDQQKDFAKKNSYEWFTNYI